MGLAALEARKSECKKSRRGVIIVNSGNIIGKGHNKVTLEKLCNPCIRKDIRSGNRVELCSALHAEQMAIMDKSGSLKGSRMYHIALENGKIVYSGSPCCTVCSRMIYESGISEFVLLHKEGYTIYNTKEFNELSFDYVLKKYNKNS